MNNDTDSNPNGSLKIMKREKFRNNFRRLIYRNPLYKYTLVGKTPKKLLGTPPEVLPGNPANGQLILSGILTTAGQKNSLGDISNLPENSSQKWKNEFHSFYWLSDLRAVGNDQSRNFARKHILKWLDAYSNWSPVAWDIEPLGRRLSNWITHFGFFTKGAEQEF